MRKDLIALTGMKFSRLTVLRREPRIKGDKQVANWVCQCECGNITTVRSTNLRKGYTKSCGCLQKEIVKNIVGKRWNNHIKKVKDIKSVGRPRVSILDTDELTEIIKKQMLENGYGTRPITRILNEMGYDVKYGVVNLRIQAIKQQLIDEGYTIAKESNNSITVYTK